MSQGGDWIGGGSRVECQSVSQWRAVSKSTTAGTSSRGAHETARRTLYIGVGGIAAIIALVFILFFAFRGGSSGKGGPAEGGSAERMVWCVTAGEEVDAEFKQKFPQLRMLKSVCATVKQEVLEGKVRAFRNHQLLDSAVQVKDLSCSELEFFAKSGWTCDLTYTNGTSRTSDFLFDRDEGIVGWNP